MKEVAGLVGENGNLQHSVDKLEHRLFWFAGRCIVWSVMHGCEGCSFLKKGTFDMVLGREPSLVVEDIPDPEAKTYVLQVYCGILCTTFRSLLHLPPLTLIV